MRGQSQRAAGPSQPHPGHLGNTLYARGLSAAPAAPRVARPASRPAGTAAGCQSQLPWVTGWGLPGALLQAGATRPSHEASSPAPLTHLRAAPRDHSPSSQRPVQPPSQRTEGRLGGAGSGQSGSVPEASEGGTLGRPGGRTSSQPFPPFLCGLEQSHTLWVLVSPSANQRAAADGFKRRRRSSGGLGGSQPCLSPSYPLSGRYARASSPCDNGARKYSNAEFLMFAVGIH